MLDDYMFSITYLLETSGALPIILEEIYRRIYLKWTKAKPEDVLHVTGWI
jgi:hypothetical protein